MTDEKDPRVELLQAKLESHRKDKLLSLIGGLFVGLVVGFFGANWMNANPNIGPAPAIQAAAEDPHDHPPGEHPPDEASGTGAAMPEVQAKLKAADENPTSYEAQMEAAAMFYRIQNVERTITYLDRAHKLRPDDFETLVILANTVYDAGKYADALPLYERAVKQKPDDINVMTDLGSTLFNLQQTDKAIATFRRSLVIDPKHEKTLHNLAVATIRKGDVAGSEEALTRLAAVNPNNEGLAKLRTDLQQVKTTGKIPTH